MSKQHNNEAAADAINVELDIYNGLLEVRRRLLSGELPHALVYAGECEFLPNGYGFSMNAWEYQHPCGTVYCIGGLLTAMLRRSVNNDRNHNANLEDLFFPLATGDKWSAITPIQAAQAIDNFLTTGRPSWETVV